MEYEAYSFKLKLDDFLSERIQQINNTLIDILQRTAPSGIRDPILYLITAGGKRIRPLFLLLTYESFQRSNNLLALKVASAIEMVHTASLIHDDIIDDSVHRRGVRTLHRKFGIAKALLSADFLSTKAISIISSIGRKELTEKFSQCLLDLSIGEALDYSGNISSEDEYIHMVEKKTASLFKCACELGALLGGAKLSEVRALSDYGLYFGIAYQILDDLLDFLFKRVDGKNGRRDCKLKRTSIILLKNRQNSDIAKNIKECLSLTREYSNKALMSLDSAELFYRKYFELFIRLLSHDILAKFEQI